MSGRAIVDFRWRVARTDSDENPATGSRPGVVRSPMPAAVRVPVVVPVLERVETLLDVTPVFRLGEKLAKPV